MKQYLKSGFSVIELIISFMISSILLTASLTIYNQISKSCSKIQDTTTQDLAVTILQKRLSNDLLGLCPLWFVQNDIKNNTQAKKTTERNTDLQENNYFYAQTKDGHLDCMTFISTNTLEAYPYPEYYIARIVYLLKKDPNKEKFFLLQRKEETQISNEFNIEKLKEGRFYTIVENIKKCKLEYGFSEKNEKNQDTESKIKWVQKWPDQDSKEQKDTKETEPSLPDIIRMTIMVQESEYKPEIEHVFYCIVPQSKNIAIPSLAKKRIEKENASTQNNLTSASNIMNRVQNAAQQAAKGSVNV